MGDIHGIANTESNLEEHKKASCATGLGADCLFGNGPIYEIFHWLSLLTVPVGNQFFSKFVYSIQDSRNTLTKLPVWAGNRYRGMFD